jgi:hypothetical protein
MAMVRVIMSFHCDSIDAGWEEVGRTDGVVVQKRFLAPGPFVSEADRLKGMKHVCIKSVG